jgi:hypothetical protein
VHDAALDELKELLKDGVAVVVEVATPTRDATGFLTAWAHHHTSATANPTAFVNVFYAGLVPASCSPHSAMAALVVALRQHLGHRAPPLPAIDGAAFAELQRQCLLLSQLLPKAQPHCIVLANADLLFEGSPPDFGWLWDHLAPGMQLLISCRDPNTHRALRRHTPYKRYLLKPLPRNEAMAACVQAFSGLSRPGTLTQAHVAPLFRLTKVRASRQQPRWMKGLHRVEGGRETRETAAASEARSLFVIVLLR